MTSLQAPFPHPFSISRGRVVSDISAVLSSFEFLQTVRRTDVFKLECHWFGSQGFRLNGAFVFECSELKGSCLYPLPPFCLRLLVHVVYVDDDSDHSYDHADGVDGEKMTATMIVMVMTQNFHHCDGGGCRHVDGDCCGACAAEDTGDHDVVHERLLLRLLLSRLKPMALQLCAAIICLDLKTPWTMLEAMCHTDRVAALGSTATARASRPQLIVESEAEDSQEETEQEDASSESLRGERSPLPRRCVERKSKDTGERHEDPSAPDKESFSVKKKQKTNKGRKKRERQAKYQRGKGKGKESIKARTGGNASQGESKVQSKGQSESQGESYTEGQIPAKKTTRFQTSF
eukprot:s5734_g3.t1